MGVLANALPGIRDVRPPLLAGYAWLLFGWLAFGHAVEAGDNGYVHEVVELAASVGSVWTAAAVSVIAYLVGLLSRDASRSMTALVRQVRRLRLEEREALIEKRERGRTPMRSRRKAWPSVFRRVLVDSLHASFLAYGDLIQQALRAVSLVETPEEIAARLRFSLDRSDPIVRSLVEEQVRDTQALIDSKLGKARTRRAIEVQRALQQLADGLQRELDIPATLLAGDQPELFAEADRMRAEGEVRAAMIPPLIAIVVLLATTASWLWCFALVGVLQLFVQSIRREDDARRLIGTALLFGRVESAAVTQFNSTVNEFAAFDAASGPLKKDDL